MVAGLAGVMAALLALPPAAAASKGCTEVRAGTAMIALAEVDNWASLHRFYTAFAGCDDGAPADDVTEKVVHNLAHHWSWLPKLGVEMGTDPAFGAWVLSHVDSTADTDDLLEIRRTATAMCPPRLTGLCRRVRAAAVTALK